MQTVLGEHIQIGPVKVIFIVRHFFLKCAFKYTPRQILGNKEQECTVLIQLCDDEIYDKMYLLLKIGDPCLFQCFVRMKEKLSGLMRYQFVANIIFILKIKIESTFGNARPVPRYQRL